MTTSTSSRNSLLAGSEIALVSSDSISSFTTTTNLVTTSTDTGVKAGTVTHTSAQIIFQSTSVLTSTVGLGPTIIFNNTQPLTTIFTPRSTCFTNPWISQNSTQGTMTCTRSVGPECYPHDHVSPQQYGFNGLYSPGVCPSGYAVYGNWTTKAGGASTFICCPPETTYLEIASSCSAVISTGASVIVSNQTVSYIDPFTAFASTIAVAWASSDLQSFTPASAPLLEARQTSSSSVSIATPSAATSHSLSTSAKASIGVGVSIAGLILLVLTIWAFLRHRKRKTGGQQPDHYLKAELPGKDSEKKPAEISELGPDAGISEMVGRGKPVELHDQARYELESDWHGNEAREISSLLEMSAEDDRHQIPSI